MSKTLAEQFWAAVAEQPKKEPFTLNGVTVWAHVVGADEWLDIRIKSNKAASESDDRRDRLLDARLIVQSVGDEDAKQMCFTEADLPRLMHLDLPVFDALMTVVNRVNFTGPKQHEELKKNSVAMPESSSSSPETSDGDAASTLSASASAA